MTPLILAIVATAHMTAAQRAAPADCLRPDPPLLSGLANVTPDQLRPDGLLRNGLEPADGNQG